MDKHLDTRVGRVTAALDDFIRSSPDVEAAAVVSFDGLPMASALPPGMEEDRVGAMSAALLSLGEQAAVGLGRGQLNQIFVEGDDGFVFLMSTRDQAVLAAIASRTAKIGFMLFEMRRAADRIGRALEIELPPPVVADDTPDDAPHDTTDEVTYDLSRSAPQPSAPSTDEPARHPQSPFGLVGDASSAPARS